MNKNGNIKLAASTSSESVDEITGHEIKSYPSRWFAAILMFTVSLCRGWVASCYPSVNNVLAKYFRVMPWQIDWLIISQAAVFVITTIPLSFIMSRVSYRTEFILMTSFQTVGVLLADVGFLSRRTYALAITGQSISGLSNVLAMSLVPSTAAIWFPANEIGPVISFCTVGWGLGEAFGSLTTPLLVKMEQSSSTVRFRMVILLASVGLLLVICLIAEVIFLKRRPPLPPSIAQAKLIKHHESKKEVNLTEEIVRFREVMLKLYTDRYFLTLWCVYGLSIPVMRSYTVLLSSILHKEFGKASSLNTEAGMVLMASWIVSIVGSFVTGPIVTKTKRYKTIVVASLTTESVSCLLGLIGTETSSLAVIYTGMVLLGFVTGSSSVALIELLVEVTYPCSVRQVSMLAMLGLGIMRLLYPVIGRLLLGNVSASASIAFPLVTTLLSVVVVALQSMPFHRLNAEESESEALLEKP